jgi:hypothetical protein
MFVCNIAEFIVIIWFSRLEVMILLHLIKVFSAQFASVKFLLHSYYIVIVILVDQ